MSYWTDLRLPTERELVVGLYDLTGYTNYCETAEHMQALALMTGFTAVAAKMLDQAGGWFVKAIGDAGLFAFPGTEADAAVGAIQAVQKAGDGWLATEGYCGRVRAAMHVGMVGIGRIGAPGRESLDIIGKTVNIAATSIRPECALTLTPALFRKLSPAVRGAFKKHTPPVSYISLDDPRPRDTGYRRA